VSARYVTESSFSDIESPFFDDRSAQQRILIVLEEEDVEIPIGELQKSDDTKNWEVVSIGELQKSNDTEARTRSPIVQSLLTTLRHPDSMTIAVVERTARRRPARRDCPKLSSEFIRGLLRPQDEEFPWAARLTSSIVRRIFEPERLFSCVLLPRPLSEDETRRKITNDRCSKLQTPHQACYDTQTNYETEERFERAHRSERICAIGENAIDEIERGLECEIDQALVENTIGRNSEGEIERPIVENTIRGILEGKFGRPIVENTIDWILGCDVGCSIVVFGWKVERVSDRSIVENAIIVIVFYPIDAIETDPECEIDAECENDGYDLGRVQFTQSVCSASIVRLDLCVYSKESDTGVRVPNCPAASHLPSQQGVDDAGRSRRGMPHLKGAGGEAGRCKSWGRLLLRPSGASNPGTIHTSELGATTIRRDGSIGWSETYRSFDYLGADRWSEGDRVSR
jgi:hypothetical protein